MEKLHATAGILESKEDDREKKWLPGEGEEEEEEEEEEQEEEEEEEAAEASCGNTAVRLCAMAAAELLRVVPVRVLLLLHCGKARGASRFPLSTTLEIGRVFLDDDDK